MFYTIKSDELDITISDLGSEIQSIKDSDGYEYLWQGNAKYWVRRAPILFPMVGKLENLKYKHKGKEYEMGQHGFLRDSNMTLIKEEKNKIIFRLESSEESKKNYPFDFQVDVIHEIKGRELSVEFKVTNTGNEDMYYSMGGHSGFNINKEEKTELRIEGDFPLTQYGVKGNLLGLLDEKFTSKTVNVDKDTFKNDAIILENPKSVTLVNDGHEITCVLDNMRFIGIWSSIVDGENSPFVCLEPWTGMGDNVGNTGVLKEKFDITTLKPGETKSHNYQLLIY